MQHIKIFPFNLSRRGGGIPIGWSTRMLGRLGCDFGSFCARKGMAQGKMVWFTQYIHSAFGTAWVILWRIFQKSVIWPHFVQFLEGFWEMCPKIQFLESALLPECMAYIWPIPIERIFYCAPVSKINAFKQFDDLIHGKWQLNQEAVNKIEAVEL